MANIGRVEKSSYKKDGKDIEILILDIRTITQRKKFTISVNAKKYKDSVMKPSNILEGSESFPDFHIWCNMANRGETLRSEIVGSVKNEVSKDGKLSYKRGYVFDPFIQKEAIYFTLFKVDDEHKKDENHLYNVVCEPYRKPQNNGYQNGGNSEMAQPEYRNKEDDYVPSSEAIEDEEIPFY